MQVLPETQQAAPVHPVPPHWAYFAAQAPPAGGAALVVAAAEVVVLRVVGGGEAADVVVGTGAAVVGAGFDPAPQVNGSGPGIVYVLEAVRL